jgi:transcriptional regulator with XRE-family HTH domain
MDLRQTFATNLRRLRNAAGMSQEDLAHKAGINRSYFSKLETGSTYVGLEIIGNICSVLRIDPTELFAPIGRRRKRPAE